MVVLVKYIILKKKKIKISVQRLLNGHIDQMCLQWCLCKKCSQNHPGIKMPGRVSEKYAILVQDSSQNHPCIDTMISRTSS